MRQLLVAESGQVDEDAPPETPEPFINDVNYVIDTWLERKLHSVYPDGGGYNDQDESLMYDWRKMTLHYLRAKAGVFSAPIIQPNAADWRSIMKD